MPNTPKTTEFYTESGLLVSRGYNRLVVGGRGSYIEFTSEQIALENLIVPANQAYRFTHDWPSKVFYFEYRTDDESNVMVYHQNRYVGYADYKPGMYYVAPSDLQWDDGVLETD